MLFIKDFEYWKRGPEVQEIVNVYLDDIQGEERRVYIGW
jgi:hypothetical protein